MLKRKAGLQKEVSKIFTGIQIPRKNAPQADDSSSVAPAPAKYTAPKPVSPPPRPAAGPQPQLTTPSAPASTPAPKVSEPKAPAATPKVYEPPAPVSTIYSPPAIQRTSYEPSSEAHPSVKQPRQETPARPAIKRSVLKILDKFKGRFFAAKPGVNPARQKLMVVMMPVLFIVLIVVLVRVLKAPARTPAAAGKTTSAASSVTFKGQIDWQLPPPYPENLRDPMVFGSTNQAKENTDRPTVKGIVYSEDNPCAVVGDRIVSVGDVVRGATVVKINPDSVEFAKGDETWTQKVER